MVRIGALSKNLPVFANGFCAYACYGVIKVAGRAGLLKSCVQRDFPGIRFCGDINWENTAKPQNFIMSNNLNSR